MTRKQSQQSGFDELHLDLPKEKSGAIFSQCINRERLGCDYLNFGKDKNFKYEFELLQERGFQDMVFSAIKSKVRP
jgi:hypothetical protein